MGVSLGPMNQPSPPEGKRGAPSEFSFNSKIPSGVWGFDSLFKSIGVVLCA